MIAPLVKIVFLAISTLSYVITRLIFTVIAYLVLIVSAFKVPGEALQGVLEKFAEVIKSCVEYFWEMIMEIISSLISTAFDMIKEAVMGSVAATGSAIGDLAEKTRTSVDGLLEDVPEIMEGLSEMASGMVTDLVDNFKDAFQSVTEDDA